VTACPKCSADLPSGATECPRCGVVLAKVANAGGAVWHATAAGKQYSADLPTLRGWIAEGRFAPTDQAMPPGGQWAAIRDISGLLIAIATGDIHTPYEPIDTIFALGSHTYGSLFGGSGGDPNAAFEGVKQQLRRVCFSRGGDAVVNCLFEYRVSTTPGLIAANQVVEIFAYGTAVRYKQEPVAR
jgi:hypothetical protein